MRYGVFSDLHSDAAGLDALLRHKSFIDSDKKLCLGDVITANDQSAPSYYARVEEIADTILLGNHEAILADRCSMDVFTNHDIHQSIANTKAHLANQDPAFLQTLAHLPTRHLTDTAAFTHASFNPEDPWRHIRYIEHLASEAAHAPRDIVVLGHGHIPFIAWLEDGLWFYERQIYNRTFTLKPSVRYILNVGSILGSREMRWHEKSFLVFDDEALAINFYKV